MSIVQLQQVHPLDPYLKVLDLIPDTFGIYTFYAKKRPIYIGKSIHLRERVISHFQQAKSDQKERKITQQATHLGWEVTAGEYSALLRESSLIKKFLPIFNRKLRRQKSLHFMVLEPDNEGYLKPKIRSTESVFGSDTNGYGPFRNQRHRLNVLNQLVVKHQLCAVILGIEHTSGCFNYQVKRCQGACVGKESARSHNQRLLSSLKCFMQQKWVYQTQMMFCEYNPKAQLEQCHFVDRWRYLGTKTMVGSKIFIDMIPETQFDLDHYLLLKKIFSDEKIQKSQVEKSLEIQSLEV
ncbi:MAG: GIY-YIG nuclease family protein [Pseudomonadota bacterium]|nr:GIY-YIG nuclease family protein [Pseudomonadota bacterium]